MTKITKGWPPKRRAAQAERIRNQKPWEHTTGPKTPEGKQTVSMNALTHGFDSAKMAEIRQILRSQRRFVKLQKAAQSVTKWAECSNSPNPIS